MLTNTIFNIKTALTASHENNEFAVEANDECNGTNKKIRTQLNRGDIGYYIYFTC